MVIKPLFLIAALCGFTLVLSAKTASAMPVTPITNSIGTHSEVEHVGWGNNHGWRGNGYRRGWGGYGYRYRWGGYGSRPGWRRYGNRGRWGGRRW